MKKVALVTGASHGIGRAISKELALSGYNMCINYKTSKNEAEDLLNELKKDNCNVIIYKADVSKRDEVDNMIDFTLKNFGSIDVVVNNAGICEYKLFTDITEQDLKKMYEVSILGTFNVIQSALKKYMINNKNGSIINISSIWGVTGGSFEVNYSTAKAGIIGMTKALAKELGPSNIRVNVIAPGCIDTDMMKNFTDEELIQIKQDIPLERIGKPEEVSKVVKFLASDDSNYITGQTITVDGGMII